MVLLGVVCFILVAVVALPPLLLPLKPPPGAPTSPPGPPKQKKTKQHNNATETKKNNPVLQVAPGGPHFHQSYEIPDLGNFIIAARALATHLIPGCIGRGVRL